MNSAPTCPPGRPITARAAENGITLGICILVLMLTCGLSTDFAPASLLTWAGSLAMPWIMYRLMRRSQLDNCGRLSFAELWAEGIASFFLGSLVPALVAYALLRYAFPDFITEQINIAIGVFHDLNTPKAEMWADIFEKMRDAGTLPTAADVAANIISFNIVAGTVISLVVAPFASSKKCNNCNPDSSDNN